MRTIMGKDPAPEKPIVAAIGDFDGVHMGHRALLSSLSDMADTVFEKEEVRPLRTVLTFDPHPRKLLGDTDLKQIYSLDGKRELMEESGRVDQMIVMPFTGQLMHMAPKDFFEKILIRQLGCRGVVVGDNFHFGDIGAGSAEDLSAMCQKAGIASVIVPRVVMDQSPVSSTRIRELLENGQVAEADRLLGRPYFIEGTVQQGKHLGRRLHTPTINVPLDPSCLIPRKGVYATLVKADGIWYDSISNVGNNPTFGGEATRLETFLFDFKGDLYGKQVRVELLSFVRPERRFEGAPALEEQLQTDIQYVRRFLKEYGGHHEEVWCK